VKETTGESEVRIMPSYLPEEELEKRFEDHGMHRGPHWVGNEEGHGMMNREECWGQDRGWGSGNDTDRGFMGENGPGMGRQYEENK
jgi:hypothetical protein